MLPHKSFLEKVADEKNILSSSTGMSTLDMIDDCLLKYLDKKCPFESNALQIIYPMNENDANLNVIDITKK